MTRLRVGVLRALPVGAGVFVVFLAVNTLPAVLFGRDVVVFTCCCRSSPPRSARSGCGPCWRPLTGSSNGSPGCAPPRRTRCWPRPRRAPAPGCSTPRCPARGGARQRHRGAAGRHLGRRVGPAGGRRVPPAAEHPVPRGRQHRRAARPPRRRPRRAHRRRRRAAGGVDDRQARRVDHRGRPAPDARRGERGPAAAAGGRARHRAARAGAAGGRARLGAAALPVAAHPGPRPGAAPPRRRARARHHGAARRGARPARGRARRPARRPHGGRRLRGRDDPGPARRAPRAVPLDRPRGLPLGAARPGPRGRARGTGRGPAPGGRPQRGARPPLSVGGRVGHLLLRGLRRALAGRDAGAADRGDAPRDRPAAVGRGRRRPRRAGRGRAAEALANDLERLAALGGAVDLGRTESSVVLRAYLPEQLEPIVGARP